LAITNPMPLEPPVINTFLPRSCKSMEVPICRLMAISE
jgi:hypothetical protein